MSFKTARVLLVDDHVDTLAMIAMVVEGLGHQAVQARSASEAKRFCEDGPPFDLLIADMKLPDGTGVDVLQSMLDSCAVPAIALSAMAHETEVQAGLKAGFSFYLTKPVDLAELEAAVSRSLGS